jgi:hypothetical protein
MVALKRSFQQTDAYQDLYRLRTGVEGTISQATWGLGMRRSRAVNWLFEKPLSKTRRSRFAALVA